jgi:hypothetical protein
MGGKIPGSQANSNFWLTLRLWPCNSPAHRIVILSKMPHTATQPKTMPKECELELSCFSISRTLNAKWKKEAKHEATEKPDKRWNGDFRRIP